MLRIQLPIFPDSSCAITPELAFERRDGVVFYFNGHLPVFSHAVEDIGAFRLFTSQLIKNGSASQSQVARAFGVSLTAVKRACKKLREQGTTDYWVNALDGAPFFCVTCAIDPGLQKTLEENILPRLLADVLPLFARLEAQRIAILS